MASAFRTWLRRLGWLAFAALTAWFAAGLLQQAVDPQNRAMKAPDSAEAAALRELGDVVPTDPIVLLAFERRDGAAFGATEVAALANLQRDCAAIPGVVTVHTVPNPHPDLALLPVAVEAEQAFVAAAALLAAARAAAPPGIVVRATGLPLLEGTIARLVAGERQTIVPMLVAVLFAAALLFYRRLPFAIAVLLPALVAIAWTGGTFARLGHRLDPIASLLDPVLLTIGVAGAVHFVEAFRAARSAGDDPHTAATRAARDLLTPALLATATTMVGLWSLTTSSIPAVVDFGLRSAFGVALANAFTFLLLPTWLSTWAGAATAPLTAANGRRWLLGLRRWRHWLAAATVVSVVVAGFGITGLRADNDPLRLLPADEPARIDHDHLAARLGGVETFHLLVPERDRAAEPDRLLPLVAAVMELPGVAGPAGPALRSPGGAVAVPLLLTPGGSALREPLFASIERTCRQLGHPDVVPAGISVQIARDAHRLLQSLGGSLLLSFVALAIGMALGLRSLSLGMLAVATNLLPSAWLYGLLGLCDHPLSVATAMIGCTMLGLIVDNSLHLLHHYRAALQHARPRAALRHAFARCGRAMTLASTVLALGFLTCAWSRLSTTIEFALLASATIVAAWVSTAMLLPAWLLRRRRSSTKRSSHAH